MPRTTVDMINEHLSLQAAGGRYNPNEARVPKGHSGGGRFARASDAQSAPVSRSSEREALAKKYPRTESKNAHIGVVDRNKQVFIKPPKPPKAKKGGGKKKKKGGGGKGASLIPVHPAARVGVPPLKRTDPHPDRSPGGGVIVRFVAATGVWVYSDGDVFDAKGFQTPAVAAKQAAGSPATST